MRKLAFTLLTFLILVVIGVLAGQNELRKYEKPEKTAEIMTKKTVSVVTGEIIPTTEKRQETTKITQISTTEETTENYPDIYTEKENGMVFYNEQGKLTHYMGTFYITGYTAEEGFAEGSLTASGVGCRPGVCAMNNTQRKELGIEWGDSIYIDGLGTYQVQDCGCAYGVIDIWFYDNATAYNYTGYYDVYR